MVPRSYVGTCRDAPFTSPRFDIPASFVSLLCHKHCRFRFLLIFCSPSRVHSAEREGESRREREREREKQSAERSGIENERQFVCKKKTPRPKTRCSTPAVTSEFCPVPPSRCPHYHLLPKSVLHSSHYYHRHFEAAFQVPEMASSSAVARGESVRCRQRELHAAVPGRGEVRATVARPPL